MSEIDNNVMPLAEDPHNLGEFDNVYQAMRRYPNGGTEDDYIYILGVKHFWNTNRQTWGILKDKEDNLVQMVEDFIMLFYNKGYSFAGIAHPDTVPSEYDGVFYIAAENGTYVNFGNNIKVENEVAIISKARKGDWVKTAVAIPNNERIDGIDSLITTIQETLQAHAQAIVGIEDDIDNLYDSIDETNQDLDELGKTVEEYKELNDKKDEEQDDRIDDVEERLDYIPKESFLSSEPACGYHEEDNVDELTADRAMRDRFGRMIDEEYLTRDAAKNYTQEVVDGSKLEIMPGSVKPEDLSPAVQEMIEAGAGKPGNITNLPDEEDLTVSENKVLKFKDKEYNPYNYSGMGRVYLRKHIVNGTNILAQHMINKPNTIYIIQYDYCLGGETIEIPENCVLQFEGGSLRNGEVVGNDTNIKANNEVIFENITISGTWSIKKVYSNWIDINTDDSKNDINNLLALCIGKTYSLLILDFNIYNIDASSDSNLQNRINAGLKIPSNTCFDLGGSIIKQKNTNSEYYTIIGIEGENIIIKNGTIYGDLETHNTDLNGEWGHGVFIIRSKNIKLEDLNIKYCWGDGICTANYPVSSDIYIKNIISSNNRRQGFSCTSGENIYIDNSQFVNTGKPIFTLPGAGIDLEPDNKDTYVKNVYINNTILGGYRSLACNYTEKGVIIDNINLKDCTLLSNLDLRQSYKDKDLNSIGFKFTNCTINSYCVLHNTSNVSFVQCSFFVDKIYLSKSCSATFFNNNFYKDKLKKGGLFHIDEDNEECMNLSFYNCSFTTPNFLSSGSENSYDKILNARMDFIGCSFNDKMNNFHITGNLENCVFQQVNKLIYHNENFPQDEIQYISSNRFNIRISSNNLYLINFADTCIDREKAYKFYFTYNDFISNNYCSLWNDCGKKITIHFGGNRSNNTIINNFTNGQPPFYRFSHVDGVLPTDKDLVSNVLGFLVTDNVGENFTGNRAYIKSLKSLVINDGTGTMRYTNGDKALSRIGESSYRPSDYLTEEDKGFQYYDTTLNKPIWWNGSKWIDSTGTEV